MRQYGGRSLRPGWSLDLTREDPLAGEAWDLGKHEVRERVRKLVRDTKPFMLIGPPPCTMFCALQNLQKGKRDEKTSQRRLENAKRHIMFCIELYNMQLRGGRFFLHEHPESASSWRLPEIMQMILMDGVLTTVCDMCAYGMVAVDELGEAPAKKCTRLMSNSPEVIKRVGKRCTNKVVESGERSLAPTDEAVRPKLRGEFPAVDATTSPRTSRSRPRPVVANTGMQTSWEEGHGNARYTPETSVGRYVRGSRPRNDLESWASRRSP